MKTKPILLMLMAASIISSCTKAYYGHVPEKETSSGKEETKGKEEHIVLTENNYIFEGDMYKYALNIEIDSLQKREKVLAGMVVTKPKMQAELDATRKRLEEKIAIEKNVLSFSDAIGSHGRRPPRNPLPPQPGLIPSQLKYIVHYGLESLSVQGHTKGLVLKTEEGNLAPFPDTKGLVQIQKVTVSKLAADEIIDLKIERKDQKGVYAKYSLKAKVQD